MFEAMQYVLWLHEMGKREDMDDGSSGLDSGKFWRVHKREGKTQRFLEALGSSQMGIISM